MAYYVATRRSASTLTDAVYHTSMLYEPAKADLEYLRRHYDYVERVSAAEAHAWVKDGYNHNTALYVGVDGRIRKAVEEKG